MSESVEVREQVRVYVDDPGEVPSSAELEVADRDEEGEYYYEVSLTELGKRLGKRYIKYDGPEGQGVYDTKRGELEVRSHRDRKRTNENAVRSKIFDKADRILDKYKIYISDAETMSEARQMAPEWAEVQTTQQGAFYYEKLPGQGSDGGLDEDELEVGDYEVETQFGKIVADRVLNEDVGDIPVDDFNEYMDQIEDQDLILDCLQAEMDGPDRKTGKQFIEKRASSLDIDLDTFYKEPGPDETVAAGVVSLTDTEVNPEDLSDETIISPGVSDYVDREWTMEDVWETYIEGDKELPTGMGNPDDIPAGSLNHALEDVDDPAVLQRFWEEGSYQIRSDVSEILQEEYGYIPEVEAIDSDFRFDLDEIPEQMSEQAIQELELGEKIAIQVANGYMEAEIERVDNLAVRATVDGVGSVQEIPFPDIVSDEYYLAAAMEEDGLDEDHLHHLEISDDIIERIDDTSILERVHNWDESEKGTSLRPEVRSAVVGRLSEVSPPEPDEYGMSGEAMDLLHNSAWPEWEEGSVGAGRGISSELREVYDSASTEDLEKYKDVCEDYELDKRGDVVNGMLFYREDSDVGLRDLYTYEQVAHGNYLGVSDDTEERIMGAAEDSMNLLEPHTGAQLAAHIENFELQQPPENSSWVGQSQSNGRTMAIDDPRNVEKTTAHEMGHALHNLMGITNDGYGTIDNREVDEPSRWEFGAKPPEDANQNSKDFYDDIEQEWERYKRSMAGESDEVREIRPYQKRHGVEMIAVGFGHYMDDPYKMRNRHPQLAQVFDKHVGKGVTDNVESGQVEENEFYNIALKNTGRVTAEVTDVVDDPGMETEYRVRVVDGDVRGTEKWVSEAEAVFESTSEDYEPIDFSHGSSYTVEIDGEKRDIIIDNKTRAMGGDFVARDSSGARIGQWSKERVRDGLVERGDKLDDIPWSADQAEDGDLVEVNGDEMNVRQVDKFGNTLVLEDSSGESKRFDFNEVADMKREGELEAISNVVDWEELNSNQSYQFVSEDGDRYNGEVVGFDENEVTIRQDGVGESALSRDNIGEIRRRAS